MVFRVFFYYIVRGPIICDITMRLIKIKMNINKNGKLWILGMQLKIYQNYKKYYV